MNLVVRDGKIILRNGNPIATDLPYGASAELCCQCDRCPSCVRYDFAEYGLGYKGGLCTADEYNAQTICAPASCGLPALVTISGWVDDELVIDGTIIESGVYVWGPTDPGCANPPPYGGFCYCNGAHCVGSGSPTIGPPCDAYSYSFTLTEPCFTIAVADNHGITVEAHLDICFHPDNPFP